MPDIHSSISGNCKILEHSAGCGLYPQYEAILAILVLCKRNYFIWMHSLIMRDSGEGRVKFERTKGMQGDGTSCRWRVEIALENRKGYHGTHEVD